jgi:hypothetical protein
MNSENRATWLRCQRRIEELDLPATFTLETFLETISRRRGDRPISCRPADLSGTTPFGMVLQSPTADTILYPQATTPLHQQHIIAHEAAHLLLDHVPVPTGGQQAGRTEVAGLVQQIVPALAPDILAQLGTGPAAQQGTASSVVSEAQEREAEVVATMVHVRIRRDEPPAAARGRDEFPDGLRDLFDVPLPREDTALAAIVHA